MSWIAHSRLFASIQCQRPAKGTRNLKKAQLSLTNPRDAVEILVRGRSRSSKVTPFDSLHMVSYYRPIVTLCLKCTVFEIWRHIGRTSPKNLPHSHLACSLGVTPCKFFDESYLCQKVKSWGYQMVYISRSCFLSARHNTGCDRRTDTLLSLRLRYA